jgi:dethiobiotin synthetase
MTQIDRIILLGTGTDVGKTYLGVALTRALRALGRDVLALKPVESGLLPYADGELPPSGDAKDLAKYATQGAAPLYGLEKPVSPHLAAREEGLTIQMEELVRWVKNQEQNFMASGPTRPVSLIETAGGCFSPLSDLKTNFDLALALWPARWVLCAPDSLGVLHDIQATLRATASRPPEFLALSQARPADASTGTNSYEIESVVFRQLRGQMNCPRLFRVERGGSAVSLARALSSG